MHTDIFLLCIFVIFFRFSALFFLCSFQVFLSYIVGWIFGETVLCYNVEWSVKSAVCIAWINMVAGKGNRYCRVRSKLNYDLTNHSKLVLSLHSISLLPALLIPIYPNIYFTHLIQPYRCLSNNNYNNICVRLFIETLRIYLKRTGMK